MAGTRLAVHVTFMVELLVLVVASFLYASNRGHDTSLSEEPFLADKSGWKILTEDISPAPSPGDHRVGLISYAVECAGAMTSYINALVGGDSEKNVVPDRPRRSSVFVQEMRQTIADFPSTDEANDDDWKSKASTSKDFLPPMKVNLSLPQVESSTIRGSLAIALERGFQSQSTQILPPTIRVELAESSTVYLHDAADKNPCDNFRPQIRSKRKFNGRHREVKFPEIFILMGCSSANIPDQRLSSVEVSPRSDIIIVRTTLAVHELNELQHHLEKDVSGVLSSAFFVPLSNSGYQLRSVSIKLIDENPTSHVEGVDGFDDFTAKDHFDIIGSALSSSIQLTIGTLMEDLSFIYGGKVEANNDFAMSLSQGNMIKMKDAISVKARSSAYLPLPVGAIQMESGHDESTVIKLISGDLVDWMFEPSHKHALGEIEWILFVPSENNTPLMLHDESSGEKGRSTILSSPTLDEGRTKNTHPNGFSIVNLPRLPEYHDSNLNKINLDRARGSYRDAISQSLMCLVAYIRSIHGLTPYVMQKHDISSLSSSVEYLRDDLQMLSFWELESIARSQFSSSLESALHEMDALMATLHLHAWTLAFPEDVAHKMNNATYSLRQSISLIEKGFPVIYAASLLHGSIEYLHSVQKDHQFMELPYFAPDHYLAVFSGFVLPLLMPLIVGLVREVKRFRELNKKQERDRLGRITTNHYCPDESAF